MLCCTLCDWKKDLNKAAVRWSQRAEHLAVGIVTAMWWGCTLGHCGITKDGFTKVSQHIFLYAQGNKNQLNTFIFV